MAFGSLVGGRWTGDQDVFRSSLPAVLGWPGPCAPKDDNVRLAVRAAVTHASRRDTEKKKKEKIGYSGRWSSFLVVQS